MAEKLAKVRHNKPDDLDKVLSSHNILHFSAVTLLVASLASFVQFSFLGRRGGRGKKGFKA